jgi:S1/P1 Nuclease
LKAQVIEVLKAHTNYTKWAAAYHPNPNLDQFAYIFMRSSTWPDEIRKSGDKYDHPDWHFIDYPLRPPAFAFEPDARPADNILSGIAECEKTLSDTNQAQEMRAVMLSYLIHLIGDEHQPLHCESLFTDAYPNGDRGGNDFNVMPANEPVGLHGIWDSLLGSSANPRVQWNYAIELEARFPRTALPELKAHTTPKEWSLESRELAIEKGYLHGDLKGGLSRDSAPSLPPDYTKNAKLVAERQGALAGYRLADEIQNYLKCPGLVPLLPENTNVALKVTLPKTIGTSEAHKYYDETMVVTGKVVQITVRPNITFINLDESGPNSPFTAVIFPDNAGKFKDLEKIKNQSVEISGTITEYRGKPEIILEGPDQIKVRDGK